MFCIQCGTNNDSNSKFCTRCGTSMALSVTQGALPADLQISAPRYAGFWFRVLASIVDSVLCQIVIVVIAFLLGFSIALAMQGQYTQQQMETVAHIMGMLAGIGVQWLWFTISESSSWQATPGKKLFGLKVTDEQGQRISFGRANGRYWSKIISVLTLFIGIIMVAFTEKKQGLHDKIAHTLVIRSRTSS
ncbi:MAG: RDD family protein [Magnetococcus sp. YQC-9]